ncbi:MAG: ATP-binding cassette domain-containing protein [Candidatus Altiarchaeota archaeon]|nr:ATP-binding cassette domain-containing protein [Candidatus Altiarchaeota archaeon]
MPSILEIKDLSVEIKKRKTLEDIDITIDAGQVYILFGPNGSGKTSLLMTLAGMPGYSVKKGRISFLGKDVTKKTVDERAKLGMGTGFQLPQEIRGLKLIDLLRICAGKKVGEELDREEKKLVEKFMLTDMLERDVNLDFSGGEKKRAEILQLLLMKPKLLLLDEPDSGVDLESLKLIGEEIDGYVKKNKAGALVITHQGYILEHLNAGKGCVLLESRIHCHNKPDIILRNIRAKGYRGCVKCREGKTSG